MNTRTWADYLKGQSLGGYLEFLALHYPMIEHVLEVDPRSALEVGCGGGNISIFLSQLGVSALGIDIEPGVVEEANRHNEQLRGSATFRIGDGFASGFGDREFDVVHSQGVLEHFPDEEIERFLAEGIRVGKRSVHSVPNVNYPSRDFGNERLMPLEFWRQRAEAAARRAAVPVSIKAQDYRRLLEMKYLVNSLKNKLLGRMIFTLIVIDRQ